MTLKKLKQGNFFSALVELKTKKWKKEEMERIILIEIPSEIYSELRRIFIFLFQNSGFKM